MFPYHSALQNGTFKQQQKKALKIGYIRVSQLPKHGHSQE